MLDMVVTALSWLLLLSGSAFIVVGAVGIVRMPDVFSRMHAAGISDTVGAGLLLAGMMLDAGLSLITVKLAIILAAILFTSPVATHALAQAALHAGIEPVLASKKVLGIPADEARLPLAFEEKPGPDGEQATPRDPSVQRTIDKGEGPSNPS